MSRKLNAPKAVVRRRLHRGEGHDLAVSLVLTDDGWWTGDVTVTVELADDEQLDDDLLASLALDAARDRLRRPAPRQPLAARACEQCGEAFQPRGEHGRFCSGRCRVAAHRARVTQAT